MAYDSELVRRLDSIRDVVSGLGGAGNKGATYEVEAEDPLDQASLEALYHDNWIARRVVEIPVRHAMSRGFLCRDNPDAYREYLRRTYSPAFPEGMFQTAAFEGRLYGGAALILGHNGDMRSPIEDGAPRPAVEWLDVVNAYQLEVQSERTDPKGPHLGQPATFLVKKDSHPRSELEFHVDQAIWFGGNHVVGGRRKDNNYFTNDSVLQAINLILSRFEVSWAGLASLLEESSIAEFKMKGFVNALSQVGQSKLTSRMSLMALGKSIAKAVFLEEGESFTRHDLNLSGVAPVLDSLMLLIAGAAEIPATHLFGRSPAGMNATGESDQTQFDRRVGAVREANYKPKMRTLLEGLAVKCEQLEFPPLQLLGPKELEETRNQMAAADKVYVDMGGVDAIDVVLARADAGQLGFELSDDARARLQTQLDEASDSGDSSIDPLQLVAPTQRATILTVNEIRAALGQPPVAGGDVTIAERQAQLALTAKVNEAAALPDPTAPDTAAPSPDAAPDAPPTNE